jgi:hypothetical protein
VSAKDLQKSLEHANISDESTIRKTLIKNGVRRRTPQKKMMLSPKNIAAHLGNTHYYVWRKKGTAQNIKTAHQHQNLMPTVIYCGESIMV